MVRHSDYLVNLPKSRAYSGDAHTDLDNYCDKLRVAMSRIRLCPPRDTHQKNIFQYKELETYSHVFLRRNAKAPSLTTPYDGPYKVFVRNGRVMKILIKGEVETVPVDQVKPAHFECEPETDTETKRKTQSKTTNLKTTGIVRGTRKDQGRSSSTLTQKSDRTRVKLTKTTQTQSAATKTGKSSAITPQHQAHRVNLSRQLTPYVVPHSQTPLFLAVMRATAV